MIRLTLILSLLVSFSFGQINQDTYVVTIGNYNCVPAFYENKNTFFDVPKVFRVGDTSSVLPIINDSLITLSSVDESKLLGHPPIYFPKRLDTTYVVTWSDTIPKMEIETIDNYEFESGLDSLKNSELFGFIKKEIKIIHKGERLKIENYNFEIIHKDGRRNIFECHTNHIIDNKKVQKALKIDKPIIYISIWNITFRNKNKKKFSIYEGYGWKINQK